MTGVRMRFSPECGSRVFVRWKNECPTVRRPVQSERQAAEHRTGVEPALSMRVGHLRGGENLEPTFGIAPKPPGYRPGARLSSCVGRKNRRLGAVRARAGLAQSRSPE